jgi:hypothetical protein
MASTPTPSVRLRRLASATLFAAAVALGTSTLADPAIASGARDWDIGEYDECVDWWYDHMDDAGTGGFFKDCCIQSGGVWNEDLQKCGAPPAEDVERTSPPRVAPPAEATAPLDPVLVTPTSQAVAPGPAKQG